MIQASGRNDDDRRPVIERHLFESSRMNARHEAGPDRRVRDDDGGVASAQRVHGRDRQGGVFNLVPTDQGEA